MIGIKAHAMEQKESYLLLFTEKRLKVWMFPIVRPFGNLCSQRSGGCLVYVFKQQFSVFKHTYQTGPWFSGNRLPNMLE